MMEKIDTGLTYQKAIRAKRLLSIVCMDGPEHLARTYGLGTNDSVNSLASADLRVVGVSIGGGGNNFSIRIFTQIRPEDFDKEKVARALDATTDSIMVFHADEIYPLNAPIRHKIRPAVLGCSLSHTNAMSSTGTFGGIVKDRDGKLYILSNNHTIANVNQANIGDIVIQPGLADAGNQLHDGIANLARYVPIDFIGPNKVDGAIAAIGDHNDVLMTNVMPNTIPQIGTITGIAAAQEGMSVVKYGRTTGFTEGVIQSTDADVKIFYGPGVGKFEDQLEIVGSKGAFADVGDSGSLIVELGTKKVVGLLFAGVGGHAFANPIGAVLHSLGVSIA